jgi:cellulose biosynthesis protein BcsQ
VKQLMKLLRPMQDRYHFLFIDSPPNITVVSENIFFAAEALLIPVIPTPLSLRTHVQLLRHFQQNPVPHLKLLPFFSMVDRRRALHRQIVEELPLQYPDMLRTEIPYSSQVELMGVREAPLTAFAPGGAVGQAYQTLWDEIKARL